MMYCIEYMLQKLGMEAEKVPELSNSLYKTYGTIMVGLRAIGYDFDYNDFHSSIHGRLPYSLLKPDPVLKGILQSLPCRKVVKCLKDLGWRAVLKELLDDIRPPDDKNGEEIFDFCEYTRQPDSDMVLPKTPVICKPFDNAFEKAFKLADIDPQRTLLTAKRLGLHTVAVSSFTQLLMTTE
ncbi:hypothetical protein KIW84_075676 [Lathyrus oleraceus]|uniref:Uncharacterized protein n=1 Tax=Pisum sativum TaxID=3888 RepID=A0A9D4VVL1_PEA|nr:hypothetical protein KIW84_075676 [Pisum sativum]